MFFLAADVLIFVCAALSAQTPKPSNICLLRKHSVGLALWKRNEPTSTRADRFRSVISLFSFAAIRLRVLHSAGAEFHTLRRSTKTKPNERPDDLSQMRMAIFRARSLHFFPVYSLHLIFSAGYEWKSIDLDIGNVHLSIVSVWLACIWDAASARCMNGIEIENNFSWNELFMVCLMARAHLFSYSLLYCRCLSTIIMIGSVFFHSSYSHHHIIHTHTFDALY